ncbi:hypothetical protein AC579_640 [Pseudocercospora musae]|uniref:Uncharacterized protein n=1 Tax=Pseudocercospora musae TaxID=113226 RepID=A0A139I964_9PEZI|nr:hypothetical protein AC579_640 [Pseudocercospora musae]KXT11121.1 hypothetical protein AC579_640 [Pseudocercospora musae]KXT11125.1 hypothetical protein AC579_640 [Pseudocercospora musae]KXT11127.1 hypothetical protein AC579_640 [Pseudocercospora musae]
MANREGSLLRFANDCEDAAAGLHRFRQALPRNGNATRITITAAVAELFGLSSALRHIHTASTGQAIRTYRYGPSFYRIDHDLPLLLRSLQCTLHDIFDMFARAHQTPERSVWEDMGHQHERLENFPLLERLECYREFLHAQLDILQGRHLAHPDHLTHDITDLVEAQQKAQRRASRQSMPVPECHYSDASTPRPRPRRTSGPTMPPRINTPTTPTVLSDLSWDPGWNQTARPYAPEPPTPPSIFPATPAPPVSPLSPVFSDFTSSSSQTASSHTSYSTIDPYAPSALVHWADDILDGQHPNTHYRPDYQLSDRSSCYGQADPYALDHLTRHGFQKVLELPFDERKLWVQLYWRPNDLRARLLIVSQNTSGFQQHYCQPLTALKVIRRASTLQLCQASKGSGRYKLWARLNFMLHERMVLFYSTVIAMKHQDNRGIPHPSLADDFELESDGGEKMLFAGKMRHEDMLHALRVFRDRGSGVVRLEVSALRGPRKHVPIWTAFVTKYVDAADPDWCQCEGNGVVSLAAIKPAPPYVFISSYQPPKHGRDWILPFTTDEDARMFVEIWAGLCRRYGGGIARRS